MPNKKESKGIVYVARGSVFLKEAIESSKRAKEVMPDFKTCLITDQNISDINDFDYIEHLPYSQIENDPKISTRRENIGWSYKPYALSEVELPFDQCLFLDTDTYMIHSVQELFYSLRLFDICLCVSQQDPNKAGIYYMMDTFNSGVMVFKNTADLRKVFKKTFQSMYDKMIGLPGPDGDQSYISKELNESDLGVGILDPSYNLCVGYPQFIKPGTVKILHGRNDLPQISKRINLNRYHKMWDPRKNTFEPYSLEDRIIERSKIYK